MHNPNFLYNKYKNKLNNENIIENRNLINKSEYIINENNTFNKYFWKVFYIDIFNYNNNQELNNIDGVCKYEKPEGLSSYKYYLDGITKHKHISDINNIFFNKSDIKLNEETNNYNYIPVEILGDIFIKNGKKNKKITINNLYSSLSFYIKDENNEKDVQYYLPYKFILYQKNPDYIPPNDNNNNTNENEEKNTIDEYIPVKLSKSLISSNNVNSFIDLLNYDEENNIYTLHKTFKITFSFDKYLSFVIDDNEYLYNLFYEYYNGSTSISRQREIKDLMESEDDELQLFKEYNTITDYLNEFKNYNNMILLSMDLIY